MCAKYLYRNYGEFGGMGRYKNRGREGRYRGRCWGNVVVVVLFGGLTEGNAEDVKSKLSFAQV